MADSNIRGGDISSSHRSRRCSRSRSRDPEHDRSHRRKESRSKDRPPSRYDPVSRTPIWGDGNDYDHYSPTSKSPDPVSSSRRRGRSPLYDRTHPNYRSPSHGTSSRRRARSRSHDRQQGEVSSRSQSNGPSKRRRRSSDYSRKTLRYSESPERRPKLPSDRMREAFDQRYSLEFKGARELAPPKIDVLLHKPVLSYDNQSDDGFMDLDTLIAAEAQKVADRSTSHMTESISMASFDSSTNVVYDDWDEPASVPALAALASTPSQSEVAGIQPDRMRRLSTHDMDDDFATSPGPAPFVPDGSNELPVGPRKRKIHTSSFGSSSPQLDSWGSKNAAIAPSGGSYLPAPTQQFESRGSGNQVMPPPPLHAALSVRARAAPLPAPIPPPVDHRSRQEMFDDFVAQKDRIIKEDAARRKANGTVTYEASDEEIAVILARMTFNPSKKAAFGTIRLEAKGKDSKFFIHENDRRFIPAAPRMNGKGHPLTEYDEEKTTYRRLIELAGWTIRAIDEQKEGPRGVETSKEKVERFAREKMAEKEKQEVKEDERAAEAKVKPKGGLESVKAVSSREEDDLAAALEGLVDVELEI